MAQTLSNVLFGQLDPNTGSYVSYVETSRWADGSPMTDSLCDNFLYLKSGGKYYRRHLPGSQFNARELGLVGDGSTDNSLTLMQALLRLPLNAQIKFPEGVYFFGPLPEKYWRQSFGVPCCINISGLGTTFEGEGQGNTVLKFPYGAIGIQNSAGSNGAVSQLRRLSLQGPGWNSTTPDGKVKTYSDSGEDAGLPVGSYSRASNNYQFHGLNMWAQMFLLDVNIHHFTGSGVCNFGAPEVRVDGISFDVPGTYENRGVGVNGRFTPADPGQVKKVPAEGKVIIGGITTKNAGYANYTGDNPASWEIPYINLPSGSYVAEGVPGGGALIADNCRMIGCNLDFNQYAGVFITGSDANQLVTLNLSCRENGWYGLDDGSFLGTHHVGLHVSRNGTNFNKLGIDNIFGNDELSVGGVWVRYAVAASTFQGLYTEQGNQGNTLLSAATVSNGGLQGQGIEGGWHNAAGKMSFWSVGPMSVYPDTGLVLTQGQPADYPMRGLFSGHTDGVTILFTPDNAADVARAVVGKTLIGYKQALTITGKTATGILCGPHRDYFPPRSPTTTKTTAYLISDKIANPRSLLYHEFATGDFGFGYGNAKNGQGESPRLLFKEAGTMQGSRPVAWAGVSIDAFYQGDKLRAAISSPNELLGQPGFQLRAGDTLLNKNYTGRNSFAWQVVQSGSSGSLATSYTATKNGPTLRFPVRAEQTGLRAGDAVRYGSQVLVLEGGAFNDSADGPTSSVYVMGNFNDEGQQPITLAPPLLRGIGTAEGLLSQRPADLTVHDTGLFYYATDTGSHFRWDGDSWNTREAEAYSVDQAKQDSVAGATAFPVTETNPDYFGKEFTRENGTSYTAYSCRRVGTSTTWKWYRTFLES